MTRGEPTKKQDSGCKILQFRFREDVEERHQRAPGNVERDIDRLLDLSRYENWQGETEDYRLRMTENVAALVLLSALVAIAAFDLIGLEQIQHCASASGC